MYPCEVAGGSSLVEPWYDSSSVVAVRFPAAGTGWPGRPPRAATSALVDEACAIAAPRKPRENRGPETARPAPPRRISRRLASDRVARQRARTVGIPFAPVESADRSVDGIEVPKGPQRPLGLTPGRQQRVRRGPVLAQSTAANEACRGW
jgi:hypothetical protein